MYEASLLLRPVSEADVPHFFEHARDKEAIRLAPPASESEEWPEFAQKWERIRTSDAFLCRSVILGSEITGYVAMFKQMDVPSVSYWFARRFWGRGLARQALGLFLVEVTERPLYARVASGNAASLRVLASHHFNPINTGSYYSSALGELVEEVVLRLDG
jgi:RimJ/RimL family protein N-acetyltransferase